MTGTPVHAEPGHFEAYGWSTMDWLHAQARKASNFHSAEAFSASVAAALNPELSRIRFSRPLDAGLGIHFTAYEWMGGYWIPELFLITNFANVAYTQLNPGGFQASRETYKTLAKTETRPEHRELDYRLQVHRYLHTIGILRFSNGDLGLFNIASNGILASVEILAQRGMLRDPDRAETWVQAARRPVEVVSEIQHDFCGEGRRIVGGRVHDLLVTPNGGISSTSGDVT